MWGRASPSSLTTQVPCEGGAQELPKQWIFTKETSHLKVKVNCSVVSDCLQSLELYPARLLCHWNSSPGDLPNPGTETGFPELQTDSWLFWGFPHSSVGKESACNAGDPGLIPGSGWSSGEGKGNPLQHSGLENSMNYSPWGPKELDTTERLSYFTSLHFFTVWATREAHKSLKGSP